MTTTTKRWSRLAEGVLCAPQEENWAALAEAYAEAEQAGKANEAFYFGSAFIPSN